MDFAFVILKPWWDSHEVNGVSTNAKICPVLLQLFREILVLCPRPPFFFFLIFVFLSPKEKKETFKVENRDKKACEEILFLSNVLFSMTA